MKQFFKLDERGTSVRTEFIAGMTTFFAMVYILMVNANMFADPLGDGSNPLGVSYGAIYIATAISAVVGTILAGFMANLLLAQASGMGFNAFFVYTVCIGFGLSYANALVLILAEGLIFILLTVTGLRKKIFESLPAAVRMAIPGGIGLFIALLGLQNASIVVPNPSTVTTFSEVNAGVAAGGRTGLTSVFCGLFFFVAMILSPVAQLIPSCTTAAALFIAMLLLTH